jgi:hypothetical protein
MCPNCICEETPDESIIHIINKEDYLCPQCVRIRDCLNNQGPPAYDGFTCDFDHEHALMTGFYKISRAVMAMGWRKKLEADLEYFEEALKEDPDNFGYRVIVDGQRSILKALCPEVEYEHKPNCLEGMMKILYG